MKELVALQKNSVNASAGIAEKKEKSIKYVKKCERKTEEQLSKLFNGFFKTVHRERRDFTFRARALLCLQFPCGVRYLEIVLVKLNNLRFVASMFVLRSAGSLIVSVNPEL